MNLSDPPITTEWLGFGSVGVPRQTARRMRDIIRTSSNNIYVRKWAERIVEHVPSKDEIGECTAIFDFVKTNVRYAHDPRGMEFVQTPPYLLKHIELGTTPSGDCDDQTTLGLSLLRSLGYETAVRVTGYRDDGKFSHVYGMVRLGGRWTAFDTVPKESSFGFEAPNPKRRMDLVV